MAPRDVGKERCVPQLRPPGKLFVLHCAGLEHFNEIELSDEDRTRVLYGNARALFILPDPLAQLLAKAG